MKEKVIEIIKRFKLFHIIKKKLYQTSEKDYNKKMLQAEESNQYIKELLNNDKPFMITRLGSIELKIIKSFNKNKIYSNKNKTRIKNNAGFFETTKENLDNFARLYLECSKNIDLLGISFIPYEDVISNEYANKAQLTKLRNLEPYFYINPWSELLKDKKVLVVHPFKNSIDTQYNEKRELLFSNKSILPSFDLITYQAIQSIGGNSNYNSWFDALEKMKKDIKKLDFEIAIIGAGAYGLPLASYIKEIGKQAIHLGGSTQILFGVYGQRWSIHPDFKDIINKHWVKPTLEETPQDAKKVENACYW